MTSNINSFSALSEDRATVANSQPKYRPPSQRKKQHQHCNKPISVPLNIESTRQFPTLISAIPTNTTTNTTNAYKKLLHIEPYIESNTNTNTETNTIPKEWVILPHYDQNNQKNPIYNFHAEATSCMARILARHAYHTKIFKSIMGNDEDDEEYNNDHYNNEYDDHYNNEYDEEYDDEE